jgi:hypothetical protein
MKRRSTIGSVAGLNRGTAWRRSNSGEEDHQRRGGSGGKGSGAHGGLGDGRNRSRKVRDGGSTEDRAGGGVSMIGVQEGSEEVARKLLRVQEGSEEVATKLLRQRRSRGAKCGCVRG